MEKPIIKEYKIVFDYPQELGLPQYCNLIKIQFTSNEYIMEFAFIDPKQINNESDTENLNATVIQRTCMSHKTAKDFFYTFKENFEKFERTIKEIEGKK